MAELILGNEDCKISDVIELLKKSSVIGQLESKLFAVAIALGTPYELKEKMRRQSLMFSLLSSPEVLETFLQDWRSREVGEAKLIRLIKIFEKEDLNDFGALLRDKYKIGGDIVVQLGSSSGGAAISSVKVSQEAMILKQKSHIDKILPDLVDMTEWNASLTTRMLADKILSRADIITLDSMPNPSDRSQKFFEMLRGRLSGNPEAYDKVIKVFETLCQSGVSCELKKVYSV